MACKSTVPATLNKSDQAFEMKTLQGVIILNQFYYMQETQKKTTINLTLKASGTPPCLGIRYMVTHL